MTTARETYVASLKEKKASSIFNLGQRKLDGSKLQSVKSIREAIWSLNLDLGPREMRMWMKV